MTKGKDRDGIAMHRGKYRISFTDAQGRRCRKTISAQTLTQAKRIRAATVEKVEKDRVMGYTAPSEDTFGQFALVYLKHQEARLTPKAYERTKGIVQKHLTPRFGRMRLADSVNLTWPTLII